MDNITLKIGERTIPLRFKMNQFRDIEEEIGNLGEIQELIFDGNRRVRNVVAVIRIMGNAGLAFVGQKPDLTNEWLMENMSPFEITDYQNAIMACMAKDGQSQAIKEENENKERDLVLEEIEAKKDPVN